MQDFNTHKDNGIRKMNQQKFKAAITDFTYVINKIKVTSNEEATLKSVCLLNRSASNLLAGMPDEALQDANETISLYNTLRKEIDFEKLNLSQLKDDPLTNPLALAYVRRGQVYEARAQFFQAIIEYKKSTAIKPAGEGDIAINSLFNKLSIPDINENDKDLTLFSEIRKNILTIDSLTEALSNLLNSILETPIDAEVAKKLNNGPARLIFGVMQLYMDTDLVVVISIAISTILAEYGVTDTFNGFKVIQSAMNHWSGSAEVIGSALNFLALLPSQMNKHMQESALLENVNSALEADIQDSERDSAFQLIYRLASTKEALKLSAQTALPVIRSHFSRNALLLLSKLAQVPELVRDFDGLHDKALTMAEENQSDFAVVSAAAIVVAQLFLHGDDGGNGRVAIVRDDEEEREVRRMAERTYRVLFPVAKSNPNDAVLVSNVFAALAAAAEFAQGEVKALKVIPGASVILSLNEKDPAVAMNIVSFFFACTQHGLSSEIAAAPGVQKAAMAALQAHPENKMIVERVVAVAFEAKDPARETLLALGLKHFPDSAILRKYISQVNVEKFINH